MSNATLFTGPNLAALGCHAFRGPGSSPTPPREVLERTARWMFMPRHTPGHAYASTPLIIVDWTGCRPRFAFEAPGPTWAGGQTCSHARRALVVAVDTPDTPSLTRAAAGKRDRLQEAPTPCPLLVRSSDTHTRGLSAGSRLGLSRGSDGTNSAMGTRPLISMLQCWSCEWG